MFTVSTALHVCLVCVWGGGGGYCTITSCIRQNQSTPKDVHVRPIRHYTTLGCTWKTLWVLDHQTNTATLWAYSLWASSRSPGRKVGFLLIPTAVGDPEETRRLIPSRFFRCIPVFAW